MENNLYYESACKSLLKQQDSKRLFQILVVIRKGLNDKHLCEERIKQLTDLGCTRSITLCLQQESVAILDVTLSLIGNACINYHFCLELLKYGILHTLNRLLERCQKDSIQGRTFRIIGNLCDHSCSYAMMIKEQDLVPKIVKYIIKCSEFESENTDNLFFISEGSLIMAIRALRKLLKRSTLRLLVEKYNVLNAIGLLLIKYKKLWVENNENKIIVDDILRLLYAYSRFSYSGMLVSIISTEKGNALYALVDFFDFQPFRVIKIIMNCTRGITLRTELPIQEIFQHLLERVEKKHDTQTRKQYLSFLNMLLEQPAYRQYVNSLECSKLLVDVLKSLQTKDNSSIQCSTLVLSIFKKCINDEIAVKNQIMAGAVGVLIEKLEWCGKSSKEILAVEHGKKKRMRPYSEEKSKKYKISESYFSNLSNNLERCLRNNLDNNRCTSPSELSDISSDGPNSPSCSAIREDICDSDNYSPVCSDTEDIEVQSLRSLEASGIYDSASEEETPPISRTLTELINEINTLICGYSRTKPVPTEIYNPKLIIILINLWIGSEKLHPSPSLVLETLLKHQDFLIPLIETDLISNIYSKTTTIHSTLTCTICNHLSMVAENILRYLKVLAVSELGKCKITRILIISDSELKLKVAICASYLINSKSLLRNLMMYCDGLKTIMSAVNKTDVTQGIITSLHLLATSYIPYIRKIPKGNLNLKYVQVLKPDDYSMKTDDIEPEDLTLFEFEDSEELVPADRKFLSTQSDYFQGLLYGNFKESIERKVNMVGTKSAAFKGLLLLLRFKRDEIYVKLDLEIMLELLEMTDRFLLPDLHVYLTECVEYIYMNQESMPIIYQWSVESRTNILRVECVVFALTYKMMDFERFNIFRNLIELNYNEQLVDDISKLLSRFMA
nr:uncharacterized protein LOC111429570 [Onthophagus taurus]XP_022921291.1 uncharacterized protein LOC111429570 [Onthophagus taurus]